VSAIVEGPGLHGGALARVQLVRHDGPMILRAGGVDVPLAGLRVVDATRSTTVASADGGVRIKTIEHLFAALGGLGIHAGVAIVVEGPEPPLADGGARTYADALVSLDVTPSPPALRVARDGVIEIGTSRYELTRADRVELDVEIDFDDARLEKYAHWRGDPDDFRARIAVARTFGFEHEVEQLAARGLASHVTPESVVVIGPGRILSAGRPFDADEPARHKLLDLIGDLALYGGPPLGRVRARRPGHAATHEMMKRSFAEGLVARD
jgi:UDP-3-O-[3-hydroxymyristoyl] N-acetylglucosamine deacetylase